MKDFGRWFKEQAPVARPPVPTLYDEIEALGLDMHGDGSVYGKCLICGNRICLTDFLTKTEILMNTDPENLYCGGSPRCCP